MKIRKLNPKENPDLDNSFEWERHSHYYIVNFGDYKDGYETIPEVVQALYRVIIPDSGWAGYNKTEVRVFEIDDNFRTEKEYTAIEFLRKNNEWKRFQKYLNQAKKLEIRKKYIKEFESIKNK